MRKIARAYIHNTLSFQLDAKLKGMGITGYSIENVTKVQDKNGEWRPIDSDKDPTVILLHYHSIVEDIITYIPPRVKIEISVLSMDEPTELRDIHSLIEESFEGEDSDSNCKVKTVVPNSHFLGEVVFTCRGVSKGEATKCTYVTTFVRFRKTYGY